MSITPGYTNEEIREFVYEYERQPHGTKGVWLSSQGVSWDRFQKWRNTVFDGHLDRGLIPREGSHMTSSNQRRRIAKQDVQQSSENMQLRARVRELEAMNEALGKAIGLLHQLNEQEPDTPETSEPISS